ncbi:hypothetical protein FB45DRAFT_1129807 [Roridomyces roridus]|uniref:F-box domain-containing protein n=1 Tax=Roridomyces roridus TaxID=1738132 RepID=A0AAD7B282_9AGAR|nr:hypothetical protein FB45DRAFT_1129807 [Roridomyces roridus]
MAVRYTECGALTIPKSQELDSGAPTDLEARHPLLMNSNEPPQDSERAHVRQVVSKADALLRERTVLSEYRTKNVRILSPLRRVPPEILDEIFSWSLPTDEQVKVPAYRPNPKNSPWVLTWVSSRWRAISVSTHSLWSLIHVDAAGSLHSLSMIQTQVQRARGLKIHFHGRQKRNAAPQIQLFRFLSEHANRWEELYLCLTGALVPLLKSLRGQLPALRRIWLEWDTRESPSQTTVDSIECFEEAPSLVDVGVYSERRFIPVKLPTHPNHITRYDLDASWETHTRLLPLLPTLVEARRLYASDVIMLNYLKAPAMEELAVDVQADNVDPDLYRQGISAFIHRSSCTLRRLCLKRPPRDTEPMTVLLDHYPSIVQLLIVDADANNVFDILTHGESSDSTSPMRVHLLRPLPQNAGIAVSGVKLFPQVGHNAGSVISQSGGALQALFSSD